MSTKPKSSPIIAYRPAIVSFIDILGFRELVRTSTVDDILRSVRLTQKIAASGDEKIVRKAGLESLSNWTRTFAFSDSIVRVRPYDAEFNEGALFREVIDLVHAQANLVNDGVLIRGGMTVGKVFFENNAVFGPAVIRAYDLEAQYANVPRIVIGPEIFRELRRNPKLRAEHHDLADEIHYLKRLLRRGDDGLWFIDYLKAIEREMDEPDTDYPNFMRQHRDLITANAKTQPLESRASQKYLWLAEYHNTVCREWGDAAVDLAITPEQMPMMETLPEVSKDISD
jgi:hypothetical protein